MNSQKKTTKLVNKLLKKGESEMPDTDKMKTADRIEKVKQPESKKNEKSEKSEHAGIFHTPKITACRLKYSTAFWLFFFGSIGGFILEGIWRIIKYGRWENHSATVWGPFCIVYGIGAMAMYIAAYYLKGQKLPVQFIIYCVAGAAVEYAAGLFQEVFFGSRSWDYSNYVLNINGRISLVMSLIWGLLGVAFAKLVFPLIIRVQNKIEGKLNSALCFVLSIFMAVNLLVSAAAIMRWERRLKGIEPRGDIERVLDKRFDNERMRRIYNNMHFIDESAEKESSGGQAD